MCSESDEHYLEQPELSEKQRFSCIMPMSCASSSIGSNCNFLGERYLTPSPVSSDTGISESYSQRNIIHNQHNFKPPDCTL